MIARRVTRCPWGHAPFWNRVTILGRILLLFDFGDEYLILIQAKVQAQLFDFVFVSLPLTFNVEHV